MNTKFIKGIVIGAVVTAVSYKIFKHASEKIKKKNDVIRKEYHEYKDSLLNGRDINKEVTDLLNEEKFSPKMKVWFDDYLRKNYISNITYEPYRITERSSKEFEQYLSKFDAMMAKLRIYNTEALDAFIEKKEKDSAIIRAAEENRKNRETEEKKAQIIADAIEYIVDSSSYNQIRKNQYDMDMYKIFMETAKTIAGEIKKEN